MGGGGLVEKLRKSVDNADQTDLGGASANSSQPSVPIRAWKPYWAPNRTETSFETPGSCIVTP